MYDVIMTTSTRFLEPGLVLDDRYRLEDKIGQGGMGTIYRAEQLSLGKRVAVKVMRPDASDGAYQRLRFLREATLAACVSDPNVVRVFDYGIHEDLAYCVMEYLEGEDLSRRLERRACLPWPEVRDIAYQALCGLEAAHAHGILHRDIKPSNVFLTEPRDGQQRIKLLDFGLAKSVEPRSAATLALTEPNVVMGTLRYLAPERGRGQSASIESEIYSLGVLLFESLCGRIPHHARRSLEVMRRRMREPPPSIRAFMPGLRHEVDDLLVRALEPDPARRYASLEQFKAAVLAIGADEGGVVSAPVPRSRLETMSTRSILSPVGREAPPRDDDSRGPRPCRWSSSTSAA